MPDSAIRPDQAPTLPSLFRVRVEQTPDAPAYRQYDSQSGEWQQTSWREMGAMVDRWQAALAAEGLKPGERVALMLGNSREWVAFDQAAMGLGLVPVPLYTDDRPDNIAYIIGQTQARILLLGESAHSRRLSEHFGNMPSLRRIVNIGGQDTEPDDDRVIELEDWLAQHEGTECHHPDLDPEAMATIVYTSGTTGRPKGVILSHRNILENAWASSQTGPLSPADRFLSFLPLSHMLERTAGLYMPMLIGAEVAFARSIQGLGEDLVTVRPTVLISVPRIYERVHGRIQAGLKQKSGLGRALFKATVNIGWKRFEHQQGRGGWSPGFLLWPLLERIVARKVLDRLGGELRFAVCGGRPPPATDRPVLYRPGPAGPARLRDDRGQSGGHGEHPGQQPARLDRQAAARGGGQDRRDGRTAHPQPLRDARLLEERGGHPRDHRRGRLAAQWRPGPYR